jgi:hypothetical protein
VIFEQLALIPVALLALTSLGLLIGQNWRWVVISLAVMYLAVFWLVALIWPVGLAAVKLVIGWMASAMLGASRSTSEIEESVFQSFSGRLFRILAAVLIWVLVFSVAGPLQDWAPAPLNVLQGGLMLVGMGLLHLGMTQNPLRVVVGLLTVIAGFEVIYAAIETSVLVAGLLGVVNLGLALTGAYVLISGSLEEAV